MKLDKSFCFMFLSVFLAFTVHKARFFFAKNTNQIFRLNYVQLICEAARSRGKQKIVHCHGQFNIDCDNIVLSFGDFED